MSGGRGGGDRGVWGGGGVWVLCVGASVWWRWAGRGWGRGGGGRAAGGAAAGWGRGGGGGRRGGRWGGGGGGGSGGGGGGAAGRAWGGGVSAGVVCGGGWRGSFGSGPRGGRRRFARRPGPYRAPRGAAGGLWGAVRSRSRVFFGVARPVVVWALSRLLLVRLVLGARSGSGPCGRSFWRDVDGIGRVGCRRRPRGGDRSRSLRLVPSGLSLPRGRRSFLAPP